MINGKNWRWLPLPASSVGVAGGVGVSGVA
jgi:hypothetical protein